MGSHQKLFGGRRIIFQYEDQIEVDTKDTAFGCFHAVKNNNKRFQSIVVKHFDIFLRFLRQITALLSHWS